MWYSCTSCELPILSLLPLHTAAYKKYFPDRDIARLYDGPDCLLQRAIDLSQTTPWAQALQLARDGDAKLSISPGANGMIFVTPDIENRVNADPRLVSVRYTSHSKVPKLYRFDSVEKELEFLLAQDSAVIFTRNPVLRQLIKWKLGVYMQFPEWRFSRQRLYCTDLVGASFAELLDDLCPSKGDQVYRYMSQLAHQPASQFARILRDILEFLEYGQHSLYELLFCSKRIVFCGLDEGEWPYPESPEGFLFKALLQNADVIATCAAEGYGKHRLHSWSAYCAIEDMS